MNIIFVGLLRNMGWEFKKSLWCSKNVELEKKLILPIYYFGSKYLKIKPKFCLKPFMFFFHIRRCDHDSTHRVCAKIGISGTSFWQFTGQRNWCNSVGKGFNKVSLLKSYNYLSRKDQD